MVKIDFDDDGSPTHVDGAQLSIGSGKITCIDEVSGSTPAQNKGRMNQDHRRATFRERVFQWKWWLSELRCAVLQTIKEHWKDAPDGTVPVFVRCKSCGSRCSPSKSGDCYFC